MKTLVAAAMAASMMLASGPAFAAIGCEEEFEQVLARYDIKLTELQDLQEYKVGKKETTVVIEGRPPQCETGDIVVSMWYTCTLQNLYTTGGCRVPGVPTSPLQ